MLQQQTPEDLLAEAAADQRHEETIRRRAEGSRLGRFINGGGMLIREELPDGSVRWGAASRNGRSFDPGAVYRQACRGRIEHHRDELWRSTVVTEDEAEAVG